MKKSSKIYNIPQINAYIDAMAFVSEVGMSWSCEENKPLFWVRFNIDQEEYKQAKKKWMENSDKA